MKIAWTICSVSVQSLKEGLQIFGNAIRPKFDRKSEVCSISRPSNQRFYLLICEHSGINKFLFNQSQERSAPLNKRVESWCHNNSWKRRMEDGYTTNRHLIAGFLFIKVEKKSQELNSNPMPPNTYSSINSSMSTPHLERRGTMTFDCDCGWHWHWCVSECL